MNYERNVLAAVLQSRQAYSLIEGRLGTDDLTEHGAIILDAVENFYNKDKKAEACDKDIVTNYIARKMSNPKHRELFANLVADMITVKISPANVLSDYFAMKREDAGSRLASALMGRKDEEIAALIAEYERWQEPDDEEESSEELVTGLSVTDLVTDRLSDDHLIKLLPKALNDRIEGGLLPGNHVIVFARPEMGKTMLVLNMLAGFARQKLRTLYVGNEDPLPDIIMRMVCRLADKTKAEVVLDPDEADRLARENGYEFITFAGLAPGTPKEIERLIKQLQPKVVVIDQLRNLAMKEDNQVVKFEKAAHAVRTIAKRYGVVMVSVTQAGDSATGKAILEMGDVDFSNTGIPAAADVMVGLGASRDDEEAERRVISLPKNKRGGDHGYFPVMIDRMKSKVVSLV